MELPVLSDATFRDGEGRLWRRSGSCSRCGACCLTTAGDCALLVRLEDGACRCADYGGETYRGYGCHTWPSDPDCLRQIPQCTFRFERAE